MSWCCAQLVTRAARDGCLPQNLFAVSRIDDEVYHGVTSFYKIAPSAAITLETRSRLPRIRPSTTQDLQMTQHAHGAFDVALTPQAHVENVGDAQIGRMSLDKQFHGELEAKSLGQMLAFSSADVKGSAGYVAMERVVGTLMGKRGTFVLQHSSTMDRGAAVQNITVVADSGTDELVGLSGSMTITVVDKKHFYDFDFQFR